MVNNWGIAFRGEWARSAIVALEDPSACSGSWLARQRLSQLPAGKRSGACPEHGLFAAGFVRVFHRTVATVPGPEPPFDNSPIVSKNTSIGY